jgi:hypothetical protein
MKRTTMNLSWSEIELKIRYIKVVEVTFCYNNVPFV